MMFIREMKPSDIPKIEAIYAQSPMKYDMPMLDSEAILSALVMVDDDDQPHVLLAGEMVAEMFLVMDHNWQTPAFRGVALAELHREIALRLQQKGLRSAYAFLGPDVPKGYDRRLYKLGARQMIWRCVKFLRGEG